MVRLRDFSFWPLDVPLLEPFGIATGAQYVAHNVLVRLIMDDGSVGLGEAAPVPHISGESQSAVLEALPSIEPILRGADLRAYRPLCQLLGEALASVPSALSAVEAALFDALTRRAGLSLRDFFGAAESTLTTDITITTGSSEAAGAAAERYAAQGFTTFKVKVGGNDLEADVERLRAIAQKAPQARLVLDGNTVFSPSEALRLLNELGPARNQIALFEQPVPRADFDGLAEVSRKSGIPVYADESLRSRADFERIVRTGGIDGINLKTAKLGLLAAWDLLVAARALGLGIMVGGMVETELSMTTSACLAAGVGGVGFVDLDTPLLLGPRPLRGGFAQRGPLLDLTPVVLGHGVSWVEAE